MHLRLPPAGPRGAIYSMDLVRFPKEPAVPRQNRVTPWGEIVAVAARGTLMGNRGGCFHDDQGRLGVARWRNEHWIACLLEFRGRRRTVMTPGRYTELFFLDEATALAAGHRPCAECRHADLLRFKRAWLEGNAALGLPENPPIGAIDRVLHAERTNRRREKLTQRRTIDGLPDGAFVAQPDEPEAAYLIWRGALHRWTPDGYAERRPAAVGATVDLLTPPSTVNAIAAGYEPAVHASAATRATAPSR